MRRTLQIAAVAALVACVSLVSVAARPVPAQGQVIDRIAARVGDDIITLSEVRQLAAYQRLVDGASEPYAKLVDELIDQWAIDNEAQTALFTPPAQAEVDQAVQQIQDRLPAPPPFAQRLQSAGLSNSDLRQIVARQIYLTRYIDYRFRPAVQVNDEDVQKYYDQTLVPDLKAKGAQIPPVDSVRDQIRELLTVQAVNGRSAAWLSDTRARLKIEVEPESGEPGPKP